MNTPDRLAAALGRLDYPGNADTGRLLGMIVALAGDMFVLKAQVECLTRALQASGSTNAAQIAAASESEAMERWLAEEEQAFTRALLAPWLEPDIAVNATSFMNEQ